MYATPTVLGTLARHDKLSVTMLLACMWASVSHADNDPNNCDHRTPAMVQKESSLHPDVRRKGNALVIHTGAKTVTLQDKISREARYCYRYIKFLPEIRLHVFEFQEGWSGHTFGVVHARSGEIAYIPGWPKVSPDGERFASIALNAGGNVTPESIEIWRVRRREITKELSFAPPEDWDPQNTEWLDSNTVKFVGECGIGPPEERKSPDQCPTFTAHFKNNAWQITQSSPRTP